MDGSIEIAQSKFKDKRDGNWRPPRKQACNARKLFMKLSARHSRIPT